MAPLGDAPHRRRVAEGNATFASGAATSFGRRRSGREVDATFAAPSRAARMAIDAQLSVLEPTVRRASRALRSERARYVIGVLALAAAYYGTAKLAQTLRYTASVSAVWPPAGVGIAALYLWGLRWWPGVLIAESIVNAELLGGGLPLGSLI